MNKVTQLMKNFGLIFMSKGLSQFTQILLLPMYTTLLTIQDYGTADIINTYVVLAMPILFMQIEQALFFRLVKSRNDINSIRKTTSTIIFFILLQIIIIFIFFIIFYDNIKYEYKIHVFLYVILLAINYTLMQYARGVGKTLQYATAGFITSFIYIISSIIALKIYKLGIEGLLISYIVANLASAIFLVVSSRVWSNISLSNFSQKELKLGLKYSLPLVPDSLSWWALASSDKTIVTIFLGVGSTGLLAVASKFSGILVSFGNIFNIAWIEFLALNLKEKGSDKDINYILDSLFRIFSSLWLLALIMISILFQFIIKQSFVDSYNLIPLLMLSGYVNVFANIYGAILLASGRTRIIARTSLIAAVINIVSHLILINYIGIYASAVSTIISYVFIMMYRIIIAKSILRLEFNIKNYIIFLSITIILFIVYYLDYTTLKYYTLIFLIIYTVLFNKKNIIRATMFMGKYL